MNRTKNIPNPLMFVGTGSDVGKSVIAAGFCRIFFQDGYTPAPFKSQNMSLNSYVTSKGGEIGRAQAVQAEACQIDCHTDMNPVLLKPSSDKTSQVILNGKVLGNYPAGSYFNGALKASLFEEAIKSYNRLAEKYNPIVIEGAGSISEINLKQNDIANMRVAVAVKASTFLIADIERGGVFGSIYGSIELLDPAERARVKGIIINKFRGDIALFEEGKEILKDLTGIPVLGVIPSFNHIHIEEEDSVSLERKVTQAIDSKVNIAVILLRRMSNFTDFERLEQDERVHLFYSNNKEEIRKADIIIIPGSKNTIADLIELYRNGIASEISQLARQGKSVIGICGGYQMMGQRIEDPHQVEGNVEAIPGLNILPTRTILSKEKQTEQTRFYFKNYKEECTGYEIHMGNTLIANDLAFVNKTHKGNLEGCRISDKTWGTYMHGILDNRIVIDDMLKPFSNKTAKIIDYKEFKQQEYDKLALHIRKNIDMDTFYKIITA